MTASVRNRSSRFSKISLLAGLVGAFACSDDATSPRLEPSVNYSTTSNEVVVSNVQVATGSTYRVIANGHNVGGIKYTDRAFPFISIPTELQGLTYIQTANGDKGALPGSGQLLKFTVDRPVTVYVAHHDGIARPAWLKSSFTDTGMDVINSVWTATSLERFSVFKRDFAAGTVTLGSNADVLNTNGQYTVMIRPTDSGTAAPAPAPSAPSGFDAIIRGVRPRGFGAGVYSLKQPITGRRIYYVATTGNDANAGTSTAPLRTINRAAQVAVAGDVVNIGDGTYQESVLIRNSGAPGAPIVFQAQNRGGVVLTGGQYVFRGLNFQGIMGASPEKYITVKGLVFRRYAGNDASKAAVRAAFSWAIEDCLFDDSGETGLTISDHNVRIERTTFQYNYVHAFNVYGGYGGGTSPSDPNYRPVENLKVIDVVLRGNHTRNLAGTAVTSSRVVKIGVSRGLIIDNVESYENYGSGMWLDSKNTNYTIRNSYFHHNRDVMSSTGTVQKASGRGLYLEKNWGTGLVENNVIADNGGAGITIVSSNDVKFNNNLLLRNEQSIQFVAMTGTGYEGFLLRNLTFRGTHMKGWRATASVWAMGGDFSLGPAAMGLSVDGSTYDNTGNPIQLVAWPAPLYGGRTILEVRTKFKWEYLGKILAISF